MHALQGRKYRSHYMWYGVANNDTESNHAAERTVIGRFSKLPFLEVIYLQRPLRNLR